MKRALNIKMLICCHKSSDWINDDMYMPIQVGKICNCIDLGIQGDDTGDNISLKNESFCELTALYWAWKNLENTDIIGLCHYRRYFLNRHFLFGSRFYIFKSLNVCKKEILDEEKIRRYLNYYDIIVASPKVCPYNLRREFSYMLNSIDYKIMREVVADLYPEYIPSFDKIMYYGNKYSPYNMLVTSWEIFTDYSKWLFDILFEVEKRVHIESYTGYYSRLYGYMSERLLNIYLEKRQLKSKKIPIAWIEPDCSFNRIKDAVKNGLNQISFFCNKPRGKYI